MHVSAKNTGPNFLVGGRRKTTEMVCSFGLSRALSDPELALLFISWEAPAAWVVCKSGKEMHKVAESFL